MATCPDCGERTNMTLSDTDETVMVASPPGAHSLAGAQMKVTAQVVPVLLLVCDPDLGGCGWTCRVRQDGPDHVIAIDVPTSREAPQP